MKFQVDMEALSPLCLGKRPFNPELPGLPGLYPGASPRRPGRLVSARGRRRGPLIQRVVPLRPLQVWSFLSG